MRNTRPPRPEGRGFLRDDSVKNPASRTAMRLTTTATA